MYAYSIYLSIYFLDCYLYRYAYFATVFFSLNRVRVRNIAAIQLVGCIIFPWYRDCVDINGND